MKTGGPDRPKEGGGTKTAALAPGRTARGGVRASGRIITLKFFLPIAAAILVGTAIVAGGLLFWRIQDSADELGRAARTRVEQHSAEHAAELARGAAHPRRQLSRDWLRAPATGSLPSRPPVPTPLRSSAR